MNYDDLGAIEYLRDYPHILEHIKFRSIIKSLDPFIKDVYSNITEGGFDWDRSIESFYFWSKILNNYSYERGLNFYNTVIDVSEYEIIIYEGDNTVYVN